MSAIEWTEKTWNPVTGCTKVSSGCKNCYAETMAKRLKAMGAAGYENGFELTCHENRISYPLKIKKPTVFFVNSMSDLFHENIPFSFIDSVMDTITQTPRHCYQILTKRPYVMKKYFDQRGVVPENSWIGVSVENKRHGVPRIDVLRSIKTKSIRFLSIEPLLEDLGEINLKNIDWAIVGGESGHKARIMKPIWVDNIHRQCIEQNTPFFFKQWGTWGMDGIKRQKSKNGRIYKNQEWNESPIIFQNKAII